MTEPLTELNLAADKAQILESLAQYHRRWNRALVENAFDFAVEAHRDQFRQSGAPYITHPVAVAKILTEIKTDYIAVAASLLHDVIEDGGVDIEELRERFGEQIALLVDGVTKISGLKLKSWEERQAETLRKMLLSMLKDLRVILIKLADRLHNMRTIDAKPKPSQQRIALETRDVYAPLAHRLGIGRIARELEELALLVLDPVAFHEIEERITGSFSAQQEIIENILTPIKQELDRIGLKADVQGRVKGIASTYNKIKQQGRNLAEIYDLFAIRIIVQDRSECYRALGVVHDLFTPVTDHFFDYIALPKMNLYQSLHTKIKDKKNRIVEVQIRTHEMHNIAENGIAAHWRYKEGQIQPDALDEHFAWIRTMMEAHQEEAESGDFLDALKIDLFQDEIYVFTPKGKLIQLPRGATPVDFAFAIHSEIGIHAIGAKVRGKIIPLNYQLESGEVVEVLTSPNQHPNPEWLKSVRTSRARSRLKKWFKDTRWDQARDLGREMIEHELQRLKLPKAPDELHEIAVSFGHVELTDFYAAVGSAQITIGQVMRKLVPAVAPRKDALISRIIQYIDRDKNKVKISGLDNLVISIANCCNPLPGDPIIGFQSDGRGLYIHRTDCLRVVSLLNDENRIVSVSWDVDREDRFHTRIEIVAEERENLLRDITQALAGLKVNIIDIEMHLRDSIVVGSVLVEVKNLPHFTRLIGKLNQIKGILKAERGAGREVEADTAASSPVP